MKSPDSIDLSKRRLFTFYRPVFQPSPRITRRAARPPYAIDDALFERVCTGCGQCVAACPKALIVIRNGIAVLELDHASCDLCQACQLACPTLALSGDNQGTGFIAQVSDGCENTMGYCRCCDNVCQHGALIWREGAKPQVDREQCVGCGACAESCFIEVIQMVCT
jgi:ferredoxin-type protein NapF